MFKQVFRLTFVAVIWKQYKRAIVSTVLLFIYLWLVGSLHADYLSFEQDRTAVGWSFIYKWCALIIGVVVYLGVHFLFPSKRRKQQTEDVSASWFNKADSSMEQPQKKASKKFWQRPDSASTNPNKDHDSKLEKIDPFEQIRKKKKLRSRAEIMIDKRK